MRQLSFSRRFLAATAVFCLSPLANAHPGPHTGDAWHLIQHWFSQPDHLLWLVAAALALLAMYRWRQRRDKD